LGAVVKSILIGLNHLVNQGNPLYNWVLVFLDQPHLVAEQVAQWLHLLDKAATDTTVLVKDFAAKAVSVILHDLVQFSSKLYQRVRSKYLESKKTQSLTHSILEPNIGVGKYIL